MVFASFDVMSAASEEAQPIVVDFDKTFLVVLVLFVALTLVLKPLLFDPILKLFEEREKLIDGAKMQARHIDEKSAGALARYEGEMAKARAAGGVEREKIRAEGLRREQEILAAVRQQTAQAVEAGKKAAHAEADEARAALKAEAPALAMELASRVLGREVRS
jgi:F-type H+-transporting ATPase subunit b